MDKRSKKGLSLTSVLAIAFLLMSGVILLISSALQILSAIQTQGESISRAQQIIAQEASRSVSSFMQEKTSVIDTAILLTDPIRLSKDRLDELLTLIRAQDSAFSSLYVWDLRNRMLGISAKTSKTEAMKFSQELMASVLAELETRDLYFSDVYIDPQSNEPLVLMGKRITDVLGDRLGSITAEVKLKFLWNLIDSLRVGKKGEAYVVDRKGNLIAYGDTGRVLKAENVGSIAKVAEFIRDSIEPGTGPTSAYAGIRGKTVVGTYVRLGLPDWAVVTELPWEEAYESVLIQASWTAGIALFMLIIAGVVGIVISRILAIPIVRLMEAANRIRSGNFELEAEARGPREVRSLAAVFNDMTGTLKEMIGNLRTRSAHLTDTVRKYEAHMTNVVSGDLLSRVQTDSAGNEAEDPLVGLGARLNETTSGLQGMIVQIRDAAASVSNVSVNILSEISRQTKGMSEQTSAIVQTTSNVDRIRTIASTTSEKAREVNEISKKTMEISMSGQKSVLAAIESMYGIRDLVVGIADNLEVLSRYTQQIEEITSTVSDIASQSGILAMNAEIEAAHAGIHGKGFSIVAAEIGSLAEQSREATEEIKNLLSEIQKATISTTGAMGNGIKGVENGVVLATEAKNTIDQLSAAIILSANAVNQMSTGSNDQATEIEQIAHAMHSITAVMEESASAIKTTESAVQNLHKLAKTLNSKVEQYKV